MMGRKAARNMYRVVIPTKLEFSASVGFIHKESVTMHGHTIVKNGYPRFCGLCCIRLRVRNEEVKDAL